MPRFLTFLLADLLEAVLNVNEANVTCDGDVRVWVLTEVALAILRWLVLVDIGLMGQSFNQPQLAFESVTYFGLNLTKLTVIFFHLDMNKLLSLLIQAFPPLEYCQPLDEVLLTELENIDAFQIILRKIKSTRHSCRTRNRLHNIRQLLEEKLFLMRRPLPRSLLLSNFNISYLIRLLSIDLLNTLFNFFLIDLDHVLVAYLGLQWRSDENLVICERSRMEGRFVCTCLVLVQVLS